LEPEQAELEREAEADREEDHHMQIVMTGRDAFLVNIAIFVVFFYLGRIMRG
jgi:hypothetical protein